MNTNTSDATNEHPYLIIGAGLAGLAMAEALLDRGIPGRDIGVVDQGTGPGAGASGGPGFLLNPLPGRSLVPKEGYLDAIACAGPWLERLQERAGAETILFKGSLLRLLLDNHKVSRRLERSYVRAQEQLSAEEDPPIAMEEHDAATTQARCPWLKEGVRSIQIQPSYALWPAQAVKAQTRWLQAQGVSFHWEHRVLAQRYDGPEATEATHRAEAASGQGSWSVAFEGGQPALQAVHLILAMGATPEALAGAVDEAQQEHVGGALLVVRPPAGPPLLHTLSGVGIHVAPRPDGRWVVGATYDPPGVTPKTDAESIEDLLTKAAVYLPQIYDCEIESLWRGKRLIMADTRMPLVGAAPGPPGRWILGAFASKGLLLIPVKAKQLAALLSGEHGPLEAVD